MKSTVALAAVAIRTELKATFPHVKFTVRSENYSGGNSINIEYFDAIKSDRIEAIVAKFKSVSFDGSTDSYVMDNRNDAIPQAKYIFVRRRMSDDVRDAIMAELSITTEQYDHEFCAERGEWYTTVVYQVFASREYGPHAAPTPTEPDDDNEHAEKIQFFVVDEHTFVIDVNCGEPAPGDNIKQFGGSAVKKTAVSRVEKGFLKLNTNFQVDGVRVRIISDTPEADAIDDLFNPDHHDGNAHEIRFAGLEFSEIHYDELENERLLLSGKWLDVTMENTEHTLPKTNVSNNRHTAGNNNNNIQQNTSSTMEVKSKIYMMVDAYDNKAVAVSEDSTDSVCVHGLHGRNKELLHFESDAYHLPQWCSEHNIELRVITRKETWDHLWYVAHILEPGDQVMYVPPHARGIHQHPAIEYGVVSTVRAEPGATLVWVKYGRSETSQLTPFANLYKR